MTDKSDLDKPRLRLFWYFCIVAGLGLVLTGPAASWLGAIASQEPGGIFSGLALLFLAGLLGGGLLGLIFAVPRSLWGIGYQSPLTRPAGATLDEDGRLYRPNSNLEEISDWLTKILVGLLLINVDKVGSTLGQLGTTLGYALTGTFPASNSIPPAAGLAGTVALTLLLFAAVLGFLWGYLWSRLHLPDMFTNAERLKRRVDELSANEQTLVLFEQQLSGKRIVNVEEVKEKLSKVNKAGQDTAYSLARRYLDSQLGSPALLARVLPLYEALAVNTEYPNNSLEYAAALAAVDAKGNVVKIREALGNRDTITPHADFNDVVGIRLAVLRAFARNRPKDDIIRWSLQRLDLLQTAQKDDVLSDWMRVYEPNLLPSKTATSGGTTGSTTTGGATSAGTTGSTTTGGAGSAGTTGSTTTDGTV